MQTHTKHLEQTITHVDPKNSISGVGGDWTDVNWKFIATHMLRRCWNNHLLNLSKFKSHFWCVKINCWVFLSNATLEQVYWTLFDWLVCLWEIKKNFIKHFPQNTIINFSFRINSVKSSLFSRFYVYVFIGGFIYRKLRNLPGARRFAK